MSLPHCITVFICARNSSRRVDLRYFSKLASVKVSCFRRVDQPRILGYCILIRILRTNQSFPRARAPIRICVPKEAELLCSRRVLCEGLEDAEHRDARVRATFLEWRGLLDERCADANGRAGTLNSLRKVIGAGGLPYGHALHRHGLVGAGAHDQKHVPPVHA